MGRFGLDDLRRERSIAQRKSRAAGGRPARSNARRCGAEREGFEPSVPETGTRAFQARPFSHSGTSPGSRRVKLKGKTMPGVQSLLNPPPLFDLGRRASRRACRTVPGRGGWMRTAPGSDRHDVVLLLVEHLVHLADELVGEFLEAGLALEAHVLGEALGIG